MMQRPPQMVPMAPSFPPTIITTEQIQKYLDENKRLILAILENQNHGKLAECAQYQALLQKNLMYLAAIADAQPQAPTVAPQMAQHSAMQPPGYFMQHPQAAAISQQPPGIFPPRAPLPFNNPHQLQDHTHHQAMQGQIGIRPVGANNGMHHMQNPETTGGSGGLASGTVGPAGGNKQDGSDAGAAGTNGQGGDRKVEGK